MSESPGWIGGNISWAKGGSIGLILRAIFGDAVEKYSKKQPERTYWVKRDPTQTYRGDFEIALLVLTAVVARARGDVDREVLGFAYRHFPELFGQRKVDSAFSLFKEVIDRKPSLHRSCLQIRIHMEYASRLQLLYFLFSFTHAEGREVPEEQALIEKIARSLRLHAEDVASVRALFREEPNRPYIILKVDTAIDKGALRKAYRHMMKKCKPEKFEHLGLPNRKAIERRVMQIQKAYDAVRKEQGFT